LRLSTNKDIADSLANLDLGGLAEGVPDEVVVVPLTELDILCVTARIRSELDRTGCYKCVSVHRQKLVKSSHPLLATTSSFKRRAMISESSHVIQGSTITWSYGKEVIRYIDQQNPGQGGPLHSSLASQSIRLWPRRTGRREGTRYPLPVGASSCCWGVAFHCKRCMT
jgi:hypothetical protein